LALPGIHGNVLQHHSLVGQQKVTGTNTVLLPDRVLGSTAWIMD